jgi:hypothetical protein
MALPPSFVGAVNETAAWPSVAAALTAVGGPGALAEAEPAPTDSVKPIAMSKARAAPPKSRRVRFSPAKATDPRAILSTPSEPGDRSRRGDTPEGSKNRFNPLGAFRNHPR